MLIVSTVGMNTSLLVTKMRQLARSQKMALAIDSLDISQIENLPEDLDLVLVDAATKYNYRVLENDYPNTRFAKMDKSFVAEIKAEDALNLAISLLSEKTEETE